MNKFMYWSDKSILFEEGWDMKILEILMNGKICTKSGRNRLIL